jgi:excisionase family DNA binding protein
LRVRHQSHPRRIAGYLTVAQLAQHLGLTPPWIYDRIHKGTIRVAKDAQRQTFLFPDRPETLAQLQQLRNGTLAVVCFTQDDHGA